MSGLDEVSITCPYCLETITIVVDASPGDQVYVEDCSVCCQPIVVSVTIDTSGDVGTVNASREND